MDLGLSGKKAVVTGGRRGIGAAIVSELEAAGVEVLQLSKSDGFDLLDRSLGGGYDRACARLALNEPDILVNNAGDNLGVTDPRCSFLDWERVMWLNFNVCVEFANIALDGMCRRGWGRIVNISSCSGVENRGPITYGAAKAALTAYTRGMGRILAIENPGIVMTAVLPGLVLTEGGHWDRVMKERPEHAEKYLREQSPLSRFGLPEEIAPMVAFCCSQHASFMHGAIVPVDAGLSKGYQVQNWL